MRVTNAVDYDEPRDSISHDWVRTIFGWGFAPAFIPNTLDDPSAYVDFLKPDLLIITGGQDLGEIPARDTTERTVLEHALKSGIPVLGVCRGMQLINEFHGGGLVPVNGHINKNHRVEVDGSMRLMFGAGVLVNSFHALGIEPDGTGEGLTAFGRDEEGYIEAFHHRSNPVCGVMWHPEREAAPDGDGELVRALVRKGAFWR